MLIIIGTSLVVYPFAGLVNDVKPEIPRLLVNKESVGAFRRVTGEELPAAHGNFRDVVYLGQCDDGMKALADLLGWSSDLQQMTNK